MFEPRAIVNLVDGLPLKDLNAQLKITFDNQYLIITELNSRILFKDNNECTFKIPLCNLLETIVTTENELIEKSKSVIGRGVIGGLIFGPAGLILGGMSGIGNKKATKTNYVYVISFLSSEGEIKNITFTMPSMMLSVTMKFDKKLKKKLSSVEKSDGVKEILNQKEIIL